jgi:hypothetical protein
MPNWCTNEVTIYADEEIITKIAAAAENDHFLKFAKDYDEVDCDSFVETYGTKWEPSIDSINCGNGNGWITLNFLSAWAPPIEAYDLIMAMEGVDSIEATYIEEGMDFCGTYYDGEDTELSISELCTKYEDDPNSLTDVEADVFAMFEDVFIERMYEDAD